MRAKFVILLSLLAFAVSACTPSRSPETAQPAISESVAPNGYTFGYGTYYVASRCEVPTDWGNAETWYVHAEAAGFDVGDTPKKGAIAWTIDSVGMGQVAIVEEVINDGTEVEISEMNGEGGWNKVTRRKAPADSFHYIYAVCRNE